MWVDLTSVCCQRLFAICLAGCILQRCEIASAQETEAITNSFPVGTAPTIASQLPNDSSLSSDIVNEDTKRWNVALPTLGGMQFWTDYRWWNGWRVQYNSSWKHWRLLDPKAVRVAWGGKQAMLDELSRIQNQTPEPVAPHEFVLLIHGLMRTSSSMRPIETEIQRVDQQREILDASDGKPRTCIAFSYASTRDSIASHAAALRELVEHLPVTSRISVVGHSMGNIVFRHAVRDWEREGDPKKVLSRLNRVVMLGPPNQGSQFAKSLSRLGLFETITGRSGMQLGPAWDDFGHSLGQPPCPFAIVAGDISSSPIQNPFLEGASDGIVTLQEAMLEGAEEFASVPVLHSFLMSDARVVRATVSFLSGTGLNASLERTNE
jgi:pimeloyl-ACP methyl ester carboxylesterase